MGNKNISGNLQQDIPFNHTQISTATLISRFDRCILRLKIPCQESQYTLWKASFDKLQNLSHDNLLLPLSHKFSKQAICASKGLVQIDYPAYPFILESQIQQRKLKQIFFTEPQLWYLLYGLLSVRNFLSLKQNSHLKHILSDIRPQNILISQHGHVKFVNQLTWPGESSGYKKAIEGVLTYLSLQDMELLQLGKTTNNHLLPKSGDFSIGMTMLASALLVDNSDCYDIEKKEFNQYLLKKRLQWLLNSSFYSESLKSVIYGLCASSYQNRFNSEQLYQLLKRYQKQIMKKQQFVMESITKNFNDKVKDMVSFISRSQLQAQSQRSSFMNVKINDKVVPVNDRKNYFEALQAKHIVKSSQGYYSPRSHKNINGQEQKYKVFIKYKSPTKQIVKPFTETIYEKKNETKQDLIAQKEVKNPQSMQDMNKKNPLSESENNKLIKNINRAESIEVKNDTIENSAIKIIEGQRSIVDDEQMKQIEQKQEQQQGEGQQVSIAKELTDTVKRMNHSLLLETNLKDKQSINNQKVQLIGEKYNNQEERQDSKHVEQLIAVSFPVLDHHSKIKSVQTLTQVEKNNQNSSDPKYFSLIQPMVAVKKTIKKKKQPPIILYDANTEDKITGLIWQKQQYSEDLNTEQN